MWVTRKLGVRLLPVCHAVNVVHVDGKQRREEGTSVFNAERWLYMSCLFPIQQHVTFLNTVFISMM